MKSLNPAAIARPFARCAHGIELPAGQSLVRCSGQLALATGGTGPEDSFGQAQIWFSNIAAVLAEAGMSAADSCHFSADVTDRANMQGYMRARDLFPADLADDALPSSIRPSDR